MSVWDVLPLPTSLSGVSLGRNEGADGVGLLGLFDTSGREGWALGDTDTLEK